jgi:energy-converting hydrogenase Eha subunit A
MRDTTIIIITAIICITILEALNIIYMRIDGSILSSIVGAISSLVTWYITKVYYKPKQESEQGGKSA